MKLRHCISAFLATGLLASAALAKVVVSTEQLNPADPAWAFKTIPRPSKSDVAEGAKIQVVGNDLEAMGGDSSVLVNGKLPMSANDLPQVAFFSNANANGGALVIDLGREQPVAAVTSYSWHEFPDDQGGRGPQVYTLYGALKEGDWTPIAKVDSRPNPTGANWGGQHGACIRDDAGKLGNFRFLKFEVQATQSPKQGNPVWTNTLFAEIDVHTAATLPKAGDATVAIPLKVTDVYVVIKSHFDLGFTNQAANVFEEYRTHAIDKALVNMEKSESLPPEKRFTWTVPGWPLTAQIAGPQQTPERRAKIDKAIRAGLLRTHALPFTMHTESLDVEDLVRGLGYGSAAARTYGYPLPIAAKMTDVPSHSWIMPTLLSHAGVKFLHLGDNPASQYPRVPQLFWWEGADGSRILCGYTLDYGSGLNPPSNWPSKNYLAMIMKGDNQPPPTPEEVEGWRQHYAKTMPGVNIHFGTLDDFARAVVAENPELTLVRGDMPDTWIHGQMSMPQATKAARDTRPLEPALETLDTQLRGWGIATPDLAAPLAKAYEQSLLYGEHTWGMNAEYGPRYVYGDAWKKWLAEMEKEPIPADGDYTKVPRGSKRKWLQSYEDHKDYARTCEKIVTAELQTRLDLLARNVTAKAGDIIVYNPLPWPRSGLVMVNGKQRVAKDVPACGYQVLSDKSDTSDRSDASDKPAIETPYFKAIFDLQRGGIASLIEKKTGRELADKTSPYALGQFLHERFSTNEVFDRFFRKYSRIQDGWGLNDIGKPGMPDAKQVPYLASTPGDWKISVNQANAADIVTLTAGDPKGLGKAYTMTFTFPRQAPYVDVEWSVTDKTADKHPEGGWLCFPFAVEKPVFTVGRPGAPINPATDIVPGTNRHLMAVASGVAITGANGAGAALCPLDSPLVSLDRPGLWWWTMDFVPQKPSVFVNLYNNMWNTNFPLWQDGSWSERVRFWPTGKKTTAAADLAIKSWEARVPLLAIAATGNGKLPATQAGITLSRPGTLLTAFGQNPDGKGTILRVWEQAGISGKLTVTLGTPSSSSGSVFKTATPVTLRGEKTGNPIKIADGKLVFELKAYAPASFVLE